MSWRFLQVGCAVSGLVLACGGATKQTAEQPAAGAPAGGAGSSATTTSGAGNGGTLASAGATETSGGNAGRGSAGSATNAGSGSAGNTAAGAAPIGALNCFKPEELPPDWYAGGAGGAATSECPVAPEPSFGYSYCYFWLADVVPGPTPPEQAGTCCYFLDRLYCR